MPRECATPCRIPVYKDRAANHQIRKSFHDPESPTGNRTPRNVPRSCINPYRFDRHTGSTYCSPDAYQPPPQPKQNHYYGSRVESCPTRPIQKGDVLYRSNNSRPILPGEDINSMFRRPDYNPIPCSEYIRGPTNPNTDRGNFRSARLASPVSQNGAGGSNNRNMDSAYQDEQTAHPPTAWDTEAMSIVQEKTPAQTYGCTQLPPTNQPVVNGGALPSSRRGSKTDELDRILAKYGKGSRANMSADRDPDSNSLRLDTFRMAAEKYCDPLVNNGIQGFWTNRNNDAVVRIPSGTRRRSMGGGRSLENVQQRSTVINELATNNSMTTAGGGSMEYVDNINNAVYSQPRKITESVKESKRTESPDFKRSMHAFPFKEMANGYLIVDPEQIAFESRKISVLLSDPNNNKNELSGKHNFTTNAKNEHILHEVQKAMNIPDTKLKAKLNQSNVSTKEFNHKKYSDTKEMSQDLQRNLLQRIVSAKNADTHVVIGDKIFPCHSIVLETYSNFFDRLMRPPENIQQIKLPESEVSNAAFPVVMDWVLRSEEGKQHVVTKDNVVCVYVAARHLGIKELESQCENFLESKVGSSDPDLLTIWDEVKRSPSASACPNLVKIIANKIAASYNDLYASRRYLEMDVDELFMLLSSDDIYIESEMDVYDSAISWLLHDWKERKAHINRIMSTVRFGLLSPLQLTQINLRPEINKVKSEKNYNSILQYGTVKSMIDDGLAYSILDESYKSQRDELKRWVDNTGINVPPPRTLLVNKKRGVGKPLIIETISRLEDASQTKLKANFSKIPDKTASYTIIDNDQPILSHANNVFKVNSTTDPDNLLEVHGTASGAVVQVPPPPRPYDNKKPPSNEPDHPK